MAEISILAGCSILEQTLPLRKVLSCAESSIMADCNILEQALQLR